ncbi:IS66 family transposase [Chitinophaga solisilvae]|uniref:IS66 family transposase n=1 Tax=Chitinophaga solisilvae TaxID=1233460 RepID=UPI00136C1B1D
MTLIHCLAHARRYFVEAKTNDRTYAEYVLEQIPLLYQIERYCSEQDYNADIRRLERHEKSVPILETLDKWMLDAYQ